MRHVKIRGSQRDCEELRGLPGGRCRFAVHAPPPHAGEPFGRKAEVKLTREEFDLLALLARNAGRIVNNSQLLADLCPAQERDLQYFRGFIGRLRAMLGDNPAAPWFILDEAGVGYRFLG